MTGFTDNTAGFFKGAGIGNTQEIKRHCFTADTTSADRDSYFRLATYSANRRVPTFFSLWSPQKRLRKIVPL
jgi:hypothetical protein